MAKYLCAVAFGIGLAVTSSGPTQAFYYPSDASDPFPGTIYHVVSCAQHPSQCATFHATNAPPPPNYLDGFTPQALTDFLTARGISVYPELLEIVTKGVSSNGTVYGSVMDGWPGSTQFIFQNGEFVCCTIDESFTVNYLSDSGYFVGHDADSVGFLTTGFDDRGFYYGPLLPTFDATAQAFLYPENGISFPFGWDFLAIDNNNTILVEDMYGIADGPTFLLVPNALIPEPGSGSLVATGLIGLFLFRRRRSRG